MNNLLIKPIEGYKYAEYLLVLNPHEYLRDKINLVKKDFYEKYKASTALYSKPHITLVNFVQFEIREAPLLNCLKRIAMGYQPFKVVLKDYGNFPSHTIYINIESKQQVKNLVKELKPAQPLMALNKDNKPHFIENPHLTIARKLLPWQYERSWLDYSNSYFTGSFIAEEMLLLKRPLEVRADGSFQAGKYKMIQQFEFKNLPVNSKQGEIFG